MKKFLTLIALFAMTLGVAAQTFYEWKDGKYTARSISEIDSITFSLPNVKTIPDNAVDLGLPSGTLWADRNIGADSPEDYGYYFAWGEIEPKSTYNWDTYKWCKGGYNELTKYCYDIDNKDTLEFSDDAATHYWGYKWCVPAYDQLEELENECTWTWTTQKGVNGYRVTGPNGNFIFLPAAGNRRDSNLNSAGSNGYYWLSSLDYSSTANILDFYSDKLGLYDSAARGLGCSVRAVVRTE